MAAQHLSYPDHISQIFAKLVAAAIVELDRHLHILFRGTVEHHASPILATPFAIAPAGDHLNTQVRPNPGLFQERSIHQADGTFTTGSDMFAVHPMIGLILAFDEIIRGCSVTSPP